MVTADQAIIALLRDLAIEPATDISLYEVGPPLTAKGFAQDQILQGLYFLQRQKIIDVAGNRLHLLKSVSPTARSL
ncbi:hypothetical protein DFI02_106213 [Rhizobium sp. PP-F2F-G20b]|nr:hypothetical protein C8J32_11333 [Rhizobium sp. PP-CC-3A-592]PYE42638.1 hypothetical protein DFI02_106213 [Rhizobium sp. PP-F2F-G20b]